MAYNDRDDPCILWPPLAPYGKGWRGRCRQAGCPVRSGACG